MTEYYVDVQYRVEADSILQAIEVINEKGKTARTDKKVKNYSIGSTISCNSEVRSKCLYSGEWKHEDRGNRVNNNIP